GEGTFKPTTSGCSLKELNEVFGGKTIVMGRKSFSCNGGLSGCGFRDGLPQVPGGFAKFLTSGAGEGFPPGESIKCSEEIAERMISNQPQNVMDGFDAIEIAPLTEDKKADTVTFLVNADQLSALVHLYNFRTYEYDRVIMPMTSGCASIFRVPFGEMLSGKNRAVIGNADVFSRPHFPEDTLFFTVSGESFEQMMDDTDFCFLKAPFWSSVRERLHNCAI
ncbi:DUF169 domain-containing protein, partial [Eubacteriales bacterium OttesenSCG-928-K08]|nr:DUF169 domain-containing protein [Eubacteriales bacterium OttesenSCG-928-K08]